MPTFNTQNIGHISVDKVPDKCPICHTKIIPTFSLAEIGAKSLGHNLELIFR
jgi:hypothetical protein